MRVKPVPKRWGRAEDNDEEAKDDTEDEEECTGGTEEDVDHTDEEEEAPSAPAAASIPKTEQKPDPIPTQTPTPTPMQEVVVLLSSSGEEKEENDRPMMQPKAVTTAATTSVVTRAGTGATTSTPTGEGAGAAGAGERHSKSPCKKLPKFPRVKCTTRTEAMGAPSTRDGGGDDGSEATLANDVPIRIGCAAAVVKFHPVGPGMRGERNGQTIDSYQKLRLKWEDGRTKDIRFGSGVVIPIATDDDDVTPLPQPGALTIQRLNLHRQSRMMGLDERDLDREMEEQHRRQHAAMHEGPMARLLLWRDPARTALCFSAGVVLLVAARAPDLVAARFPVNPVVMAAYAAMAYLCRAYVLAAAFSRRNHGLTVDVEGAADFARWCAGCANAVTHAHGDLLSGRSNGAVLRAFLGLYVIACLGGLLNSTWGVTCVLWAAAFTAPPAVDAKRQSIAAATAWFFTEVGGRWAARSSNQRWGVSAAVLAVVFVASPLYTRLVLVFVTLVALRLYRETHLKQVESFERAMKDAGRRLSRAGSEFHAMVGSPAQMFYRRRAAANNSHGMSTLGRGGTHSGISWNN